MTPKKRWFVGTLVLALSTLLAAGYAVGDDDGERERLERNWKNMPRNVATVANDQYKSECGACHMAYQPGLLPARSWQRLMGGLEDHFGDNAELPPETAQAVATYLVEYASDRADSRTGAKIGLTIAAGDAPLRMTETMYFVRKHDEIPEYMVKGNAQVKSFANCAACHRSAEQGTYDEHDVRIPGFERAHF